MSSFSTELSIISARKTVTAAGTREPLATGQPEDVRVRAVTIKGTPTNTDLIFIGDSGVTSANGYCLRPGETINFEVSTEEWKNGVFLNMNHIYLDAAVSGEGVCYIYVRN